MGESAGEKDHMNTYRVTTETHGETRINRMTQDQLDSYKACTAALAGFKILKVDVLGKMRDGFDAEAAEAAALWAEVSA